MPVPLRWVIVSVLIIGLFVIPYLLLGSTIAANPLSTKSLRRTFNEQSNMLSGSIVALGIIGTPTNNVACVDDSNSTWMASYLCLDEDNYPYNTAAISRTALNSYPKNAAKLDALLRQNGWVNDRPYASVTTVAASNPYLPANSGNGAEVPFHKNIGDISCNLEIDFNSLVDIMNPGSINVNQFSCQQRVRLLMPGSMVPGGV